MNIKKFGKKLSFSLLGIFFFLSFEICPDFKVWLNTLKVGAIGTIFGICFGFFWFLSIRKLSPRILNFIYKTSLFFLYMPSVLVIHSILFYNPTFNSLLNVGLANGYMYGPFFGMQLSLLEKNDYRSFFIKLKAINVPFLKRFKLFSIFCFKKLNPYIILLFIFSCSSFTCTMFLGGPSLRTLEVEVYHSFWTDLNFLNASLYTFSHLFLVFGLLLFHRNYFLVSQKEKFRSSSGRLLPIICMLGVWFFPLFKIFSLTSSIEADFFASLRLTLIIALVCCTFVFIFLLFLILYIQAKSIFYNPPNFLRNMIVWPSVFWALLGTGAWLFLDLNNFLVYLIILSSVAFLFTLTIIPIFDVNYFRNLAKVSFSLMINEKNKFQKIYFPFFKKNILFVLLMTFGYASTESNLSLMLYQGEVFPLSVQAYRLMGRYEFLQSQSYLLALMIIYLLCLSLFSGRVIHEN